MHCFKEKLVAMFSSGNFQGANAPDAFGDLFTQFNQDTNPDSLGGSFSGAFRPGLQEGVDGFGPGDYSGDYTGDGDRVYWGPYNGSESSDANTAHHTTVGSGGPTSGSTSARATSQALSSIK
jgi:hypothetical protein